MDTFFKIEIQSAFPEWERYAVYMTAVCFDAGGVQIDYVSVSSKDTPLVTPPCARADLYLYVIAREFPASPLIADSPPFDIRVSVSTATAAPAPFAAPAKTTIYPVNQWGGLSIRQSLA